MFTPVQTPRTRKTRIVCISDTHNASPADGAFKLPPGDVLIHAGDLTNQGSLSELKKTVKWLEEADYKAKIVVAGNHDLNLDPEYHSTRALISKPSDSELLAARALLTSSPSITYLAHSSATISLPSSDGPPTTFRVFGSPYVPARGTDWAFSYPPDSPTATELCSQIPLDTDIVVTHTPPYNHCDQSPKWGTAGCKELRNALWRVRPKLVVCGHVHEARGAEVVRWKLGLRHVAGAEELTMRWEDPGMGGRKMSLLDLTGKVGRKLLNDGGIGVNEEKHQHVFSVDGQEERYEDDETDSSSTSFDQPERLATRFEPTKTPTVQGQRRRPSAVKQTSTRPDNGRTGRLETCIVNAAIMARSHGNGPKRYNKPIVVDIDLPISPLGADREAVEEFIHHLQPAIPTVPVVVPSQTTYSSTTSSSEYTTSSYESETSTSGNEIYNTFYSR
ncbi:hypothetical protein MBLNU457_5124t1 [Dothideomycetes sp. NU457]